MIKLQNLLPPCYSMLHISHSVGGVLRLNSTQIIRLAPVSRKPASAIVSFSSDHSKEHSTKTPPAEDETMEKDDKKEEHGKDSHNVEHGNIMSHSFGEGYATRSDEEGFGGVYGENQSLGTHSEIHAEYDKTQGSEVAGKEKGRNQPNCS